MRSTDLLTVLASLRRTMSHLGRRMVRRAKVREKTIMRACWRSAMIGAAIRQCELARVATNDQLNESAAKTFRA